MKGKPHLSLLMTLLYVALYTAPRCLAPRHSPPRPFHEQPGAVQLERALHNLFAYMYHHRRHEGVTIRRSFSLPKVPSAQPPFPADDNAFVRNLGLHVMPDASWKVLRTYAGAYTTGIGTPGVPRWLNKPPPCRAVTTLHPDPSPLITSSDCVSSV
jgi:hypothetical protein